MVLGWTGLGFKGGIRALKARPGEPREAEEASCGALDPGNLTYHERWARLRQISPLLTPGSVGQSFLKVVEEPCPSCEDRQNKARPVFQALAKGYIKRAQLRASRAREQRKEKKEKRKAKKAKKAAGVLLSEDHH